MVWFLIVIFIGFSFIFLNIMFTILLVEKVSSLFTAHACNLLIAPCSSLVATLCFLVVIYITRSSAKSDSSTPFPNSSRMLLIATRKQILLSTPFYVTLCLSVSCGSSTLTLVYLLIIIFLMKSSFSYISIFSNCLNVLFLLNLLEASSMSKKILAVFSLLLN